MGARKLPGAFCFVQALHGTGRKESEYEDVFEYSVFSSQVKAIFDAGIGWVGPNRTASAQAGSPFCLTVLFTSAPVFKIGQNLLFFLLRKGLGPCVTTNHTPGFPACEKVI
jgi:hypothetical protein